jgi:anti-sigma regulatory factor (Ser/Thr protein kinase)
MDEILRLRLSGGRDAPARARQALQGLSGSLAELGESVRLLVSELVTNSVRHAGAGAEELIELELTSSPQKVRVEVGDRGPGFEPVKPRPKPERSGFGMLLLDQLADRWGVRIERGTRVWFEIDRVGRGIRGRRS